MIDQIQIVIPAIKAVMETVLTSLVSLRRVRVRRRGRRPNGA